MACHKIFGLPNGRENGNTNLPSFAACSFYQILFWLRFYVQFFIFRKFNTINFNKIKQNIFVFPLDFLQFTNMQRRFTYKAILFSPIMECTRWQNILLTCNGTASIHGKCCFWGVREVHLSGFLKFIFPKCCHREIQKEAQYWSIFIGCFQLLKNDNLKIKNASQKPFWISRTNSDSTPIFYPISHHESRIFKIIDPGNF